MKRMQNLINPFRYIAGTRSLVWGISFIVASALVEWSGGIIQDGLLHYTLRPSAVWQPLVIALLSWALIGTLLYLGGMMLSLSHIRPIDVYGTTAFAHLALVPAFVVMVLPPVRTVITGLVDDFAGGGVVALDTGTQVMLTLFAVWELLWIVLWYIWTYKAFATSCNVRGIKAVLFFIAAQMVAMLFVPYIYNLVTAVG